MTAPEGRPEAGPERITLRTADDVVLGRRRVREIATHAGLDLVAQTKLVTAFSEVARNAVVHGGGGHALVRVVDHDGVPSRRSVEVEIDDDGPGIPDMDRAMTGGWSSGTGLGLGLPGSQRLVHEFAIDSSPGAGTRVRMVMWRRGR